MKQTYTVDVQCRHTMPCARYLLYNFAGTLLVDLSQHASKVLFLSSTLGVNIIWLLGNITIILLANYSSEGGTIFT